jgi:hypothetical protein
MKKPWIMVLLILIAGLTSLLISGGCVRAHADGVAIQYQIGPGGETCFVFYNGATPFAGQCK